MAARGDGAVAHRLASSVSFLLLAGCLQAPTLDGPDDVIDRFHFQNPGAELEAGCEDGLVLSWSLPAHPLVDHYRVLVHHGEGEVEALDLGHQGEGQSSFPPEMVDACAPICSFTLVAVDGAGRQSEPLLTAEVLVDADGDGYASIACGGTDCDDDDPDVHPGAIEQCDGRDTSCSGVVDDVDPALAPEADEQRGVCAGALKVCEGGEWVEPDYALHHPDYDPVERCNGLDNSCSGLEDDVDPDDVPEADEQRGVCAGALKVCDGVNGWVEPDFALHHPDYDPIERCNNLDNSCTGEVDDVLLEHAEPADKQDGVCAGAVKACIEGEWVEPDYFAYSDLYDTEDRCEGDDNDCDGHVDKVWGVDPSSGEVLCTGFYVRARPDFIAAGPFRELASNGVEHMWGAGRPMSCVIDLDDRLLCWGEARHGALGNGFTSGWQPEPTEVEGGGAWSSVALAFDQACGIHLDGSLWCWGARYAPDDTADWEITTPTWTSAVPAPMPGTWESVSLGFTHGCGLQADGTLWCWGRNRKAQLGLGDLDDREDPVQVGDDVWAQVSAGSGHTCALDLEGDLWCWGRNDHGQLGAPLSDHEPSFKEVVHPGGLSWSMVDAGGDHTCALDEENAVWCWGRNSYDALGTGPESSSPEPRPTLPGPVQALDASFAMSCALTLDDELWCWGYGPLGDGRFLEQRADPAPVEGAWSAVGATTDHACALSALDGSVWCWGIPRAVTFSNYHLPRLILDQGVRSLSLGAEHGCVVDALEGGVWCFGLNEAGELGTGDDRGTIEAVRVLEEGFHQVEAGSAFTCALDDQGARWCWGSNHVGRLGDGSTTSRNTPWQADDGPWQALALGSFHACAIDTAHVLSCWGHNGDGRLGLGDTTHRHVPSPLAGTWAAVSAGHSHTCAIDMDGELWCWGSGANGRLGNDSTTASHDPVEVHADVPWQQVSAGISHTCAIDIEEQLWCWGANLRGQLGLGDSSQRLVPTKLPGTWSAVSAGSAVTCALDTAGEPWCWGSNNDGELGIDWNDTWQVNVPLPMEGEWNLMSAGSQRICRAELEMDLVPCVAAE